MCSNPHSNTNALGSFDAYEKRWQDLVSSENVLCLLQLQMQPCRSLERICLHWNCSDKRKPSIDWAVGGRDKNQKFWIPERITPYNSSDYAPLSNKYAPPLCKMGMVKSTTKKDCVLEQDKMFKNCVINQALSLLTPSWNQIGKVLPYLMKKETELVSENGYLPNY